MAPVWPTWRDTQEGNLNKDSTHPNPWRPPTQWCRWAPASYQPYRIYRGNPEGPVKPAHNFLEDDPFLDNVRIVGTKSFLFGTAYAANDIIVLNRIDAPRAQLARYFFVMPPFIAIGLTYISAREILGNLSTKKNDTWTYGVATLAPATIWGIFKNSVLSGTRFFMFGAIFAIAYKTNKDVGDLGGNPLQEMALPYDPEKGTAMPKSWDALGWKGTQSPWGGIAAPGERSGILSWFTPNIEPEWKKHVSEEEATKGPPTNY